MSLLSLPPDASCYSSKLHLRPHTSCLWPVSLTSKLFLDLRSRCRMLLSREPVLRNLLFQAMLPIRPSCPASWLTSLHLLVSQTWRRPELVPTARWLPRFDHYTLVTVSEGPRSYSFVTLLEDADQRYTQEPRPTARMLVADQSTRLR